MRSEQEWFQIVRAYRDADDGRSLVEVLITIVPILFLWGAALALLSLSPLLAFLTACGIGLFLMRVMCIQHDCGHFALFKERKANILVGRVCSVFTLTPFEAWRQMHQIHHNTHGNLDCRDIGEVMLLTVDEYRARSRLKKLLYRIYRSRIFLFGIAPLLLFVVQYRLPAGLWRNPVAWKSCLQLNAFLIGIYGTVAWFFGLQALLLILLPSMVIGATAGVITFYGHHQFEESPRFFEDDWHVHKAALEASSFVKLPRWLDWFTANIAIHHVHHLYPKVPFYRLPEVVNDHPELQCLNEKSLRDLIHSFKLKLYDVDKRRLVTFADV